MVLLVRITEKAIDELETSSVRCKPEAIGNLCKTTKFNRDEIKRIYQGFKQVIHTRKRTAHTPYKHLFSQIKTYFQWTTLRLILFTRMLLGSFRGP